MGLQSIVTGYIRLNFLANDADALARARETIATYPDYDEVWPFTNIFWADSPAQYFLATIRFAGAYKQVEEAWAEWLWKFSQLLSRLDALDAFVHLETEMIGSYSWRLGAKRWYEAASYEARQGSLIGSAWIILDAPQDDFSIDPEWLARTEKNLMNIDEQTGQLVPYKWDKFVARGIELPET